MVEGNNKERKSTYLPTYLDLTTSGAWIVPESSKVPAWEGSSVAGGGTFSSKVGILDFEGIVFFYAPKS